MRRKWIGLSVLLVLVLAGGYMGYIQWQYHQIFAETEDAYVKGSIYTVAPRVPGVLMAVDVQENQEVTAGQVIADLDPRDYDAAVARAEAAAAEAGAALATDQATIARAEAQVAAAESQLALARVEKERIAALYAQQTATRQEYDRATTAEQVAQTQGTAAQKGVAVAVAAQEVSRRKVEVARTALESARLQRSYCTIVSPVPGVVSRKMAERGDVVAAGQPICAVVPVLVQDLWVEANFKETQLKEIRPGQRVTLWADVDRDRKYAGTVESVSAGTGAAFSLLPPENATGNWVKVVQRVPVRIRIDPQEGQDTGLRLGLSVTVSVDTRSR